ncbi:Aminotransferase class IV [Parasponia andersonii]|uniref:Aminotransferase class IV n=1 Tax=Parasponia andersonii TaxID=3476 RepID=A0A2P5B6M9_PARAD|nr:Aminotransferase class IV [Parasponia andersonii]
MTSSKFLFSNGVVSHSGNVPPVTTFLENHPGAYTTTRSHNNGACLLFWERHLKRLSQSVRILSNSYPQLLFEATKFSKEISPPLSAISGIWESELRGLVNDSMSKVLPIALNERTEGEELSITALVTGNLENLSRESVGKFLDVHVYIDAYAPPVFGTRENGAHLALVGQGREAASAKYSDWVRVRKSLEKLRPPPATDLLLSNDGDRILEGSVSNFFVVCRKDKVEDKGKCFDETESTDCFEVQTAPVGDGVLPGIIRQLVIEVCLAKGITFREVAPMWSEHEIWEEAFITNSLRLLQHVETVSIPDSWDSLDLKSWKEISWNKKQFEGSPGLITRTIQKEVMEKAVLEGYSSGDFV